MSDQEASPDIAVVHIVSEGTPAREVRNYKKALREAYMFCTTVLLRCLKPANMWTKPQGPDIEDTRTMFITKATEMCENLIAELHESKHTVPVDSVVYVRCTACGFGQ